MLPERPHPRAGLCGHGPLFPAARLCPCAPAPGAEGAGRHGQPGAGLLRPVRGEKAGVRQHRQLEVPRGHPPGDPEGPAGDSGNRRL